MAATLQCLNAIDALMSSYLAVAKAGRQASIKCGTRLGIALRGGGLLEGSPCSFC